MNDAVCSDLVAWLRRDLEALEALDAESQLSLRETSGLMLLMLFVGGGAVPFNADRMWLVERFGSGEWEEVVERLEGWPWRPKYCGSWRVVWRDAVRVREGGRIEEIV